MTAVIFLVIIAIGLVATIALLARARREREFEQWVLSRKTVLLKILVPKNNDKTPVAAQNLFAALHGIFRPGAKFHEHLSFEIAARNKAIEFYVHCPVEYREFIEGQFYAQYPSIEIQEVTDYARVSLGEAKVAASELSLNKSDVFPIKTFPNFEVDPLAGITGALSHIGENDQIWIQVLARPVSDSWQARALGYVAAVRSGNLRTDSFLKMVFKGMVDIFKPAPPAKPGGGGPKQLPANQEAALKAAEEKATKLGFATKIRVVALAPDQATAQSRINAISGAFKQFNTTNVNGFKSGKIVADSSAVETYKARTFLDEGSVLNIEELASVYHLPNVSVETPNIVWAGAKKGEPPANLPAEGAANNEELTFFGKTDFRGFQQKFGIKIRDRMQHMYAIGKSGTGKTTLLQNMAIDDIRKGRGVAIADPHGDYINHVLNFIPEERIKDVIYFNPADREFPLGFNILENVDPELKNIVASNLMSIFTKLWANVWSARMEYILRNAILALMEYPGATMLSLMRLLVNKDFRARVLDHVTDPVVRDFFINEYNKWDPKFRTEAIAAIQNKIGQFLSSSTIRNLIGQKFSTFDIEDAMNSRKILLLDLSLGKIGEDVSALLGSMMITKIQLAAMRRANINEEERVPFFLYVDEFQNFATESFATILSEARKYRLSLIMTNQYIAQMQEPVAKAIFGNVGTIISFRVGASDAVALVKEYEPVFEANDLINLDNHHIYVKMSIDGVTRPAFSAKTLPPLASDGTDFKEEIIRFSREMYARPREEVERQIAEGANDEEPREAFLDKSPSPDGQVAAGGGDQEKATGEEEAAPPRQPDLGITYVTKGDQWQILETREGDRYESLKDESGHTWVFALTTKSGESEEGSDASGKERGDQEQTIDQPNDTREEKSAVESPVHEDEAGKQEEHQEDEERPRQDSLIGAQETESSDSNRTDSAEGAKQRQDENGEESEQPPDVQPLKPDETVTFT